MAHCGPHRPHYCSLAAAALPMEVRWACPRLPAPCSCRARSAPRRVLGGPRPRPVYTTPTAAPTTASALSRPAACLGCACPCEQLHNWGQNRRFASLGGPSSPIAATATCVSCDIATTAHSFCPPCTLHVCKRMSVSAFVRSRWEDGSKGDPHGAGGGGATANGAGGLPPGGAAGGRLVGRRTGHLAASGGQQAGKIAPSEAHATITDKFS
jgi:hypothetical protein